MSLDDFAKQTRDTEKFFNEEILPRIGQFMERLQTPESVTHFVGMLTSIASLIACDVAADFESENEREFMVNSIKLIATKYFELYENKPPFTH